MRTSIRQSGEPFQSQATVGKGAARRRATPVVLLKQRRDRFVEHAVDANHLAQGLAIVPIGFPISLHEPHPPADTFGGFEQSYVPAQDVFDKSRNSASITVAAAAM